jgi:hypothetical protein
VMVNIDNTYIKENNFSFYISYKLGIAIARANATIPQREDR